MGLEVGSAEELNPSMSSPLGSWKRENQSRTRYITSNLFLNALEELGTNEPAFA